MIESRQLLQESLAAIERLQARLGIYERAAHAPIAIIGTGCRYAGGVEDLQSLWRLLRNGIDAVGEVPANRWDVDAYYDADPSAPGKMITKRGGFLTQVDRFDPQFFGISPREATTMDPQQRLLLETAYEALESAAIAPDRLVRSSTGVFIGITTSDYGQLMRTGGPASADVYSATGSALNAAAGRLSFTFGLHGPCVAVDTACSSSLVAVHLACQSLRTGESDMALAGGVNVVLSPDATVLFSKWGMMAPDGACKTFDATADGFVRAEGCAVIALKRLSDAIAAGDPILAVIRGSAVNSDGRSSGLTVPNGLAQQAVVRSALTSAELQPADIDYVEAHGTGTSLGDPIEIEALDVVLREGRARQQPLLVGSIKTNIGHAEAASGVAGLLKVVASVHHEAIPPHLHFSIPSPHISWANLAIAVPTTLTPWPRGDRARRAGVSSFGFSGTNAHVVLEEAPVRALANPLENETDAELRIVTISARTEVALRDSARRLNAALDAPDAPTVADVATTLATGRTHHSHRAAILCDSHDQLRRGLSALEAGDAPKNGARGDVRSGERQRIAFLFTGQGSQYVGMGRALYASEPVFRAVLDRAAQALASKLAFPLLDVMFGNADCGPLLGETSYTQPALFALEFGLAELWRSWGVVPEIVAGHSIGEYVAASIAGVFTFEDGLALVAERGRLMQALPVGGAMAAVFCAQARLVGHVAVHADKLAVASVNGPNETVLSGEANTLRKVLALLAAEGVQSRELDVSHAFHSPLLEPMLGALEARSRTIAHHLPRISFVSNVSGSVFASGQGPDAGYWARHAREPVSFAACLASMRTAGVTTLIEVGPHPTLLTLAAHAQPDAPWAAISSLRRGRDDRHEMLASLSELYVRGAAVRWDAVSAVTNGRRVALPTYPFQRERYWLDHVAGISKPAALSRAVGTTARAKLFYEVAWHNAPVKPVAGRLLVGPEAFVPLVRQRFSDLAAQHGLSIYEDLLPDLSRLSCDHIVVALLNLGFDFTPGRRFKAADEFVNLRVASRYVRLFRRLLDILVEDGVLSVRGSDFEVLSRPIPSNGEEGYDTLLRRFSAADAELRMLRRCGPQLAGVLRGEQDPLQLLFPSGSLDEARKLYVDSPYVKTYNSALGEALQAAVARLPADARLRVLEVGAGTGGTTAYVLPLLDAERTEYTFTDLSPIFLERATRQFASYPFVRTALLDIEHNPTEQGFAAARYDIVIAANVLHATADLKQTLRHVQRLMAPGGLLFLLEGLAPARWVDLTFGLTEGWWRFTDTSLRPNYCLISSARWIDLLRDLDFRDVGSLIDGSGAVPHGLIVARAPAGGRQWILCGSGGGVAEQLEKLLIARGDIVAVLDTHVSTLPSQQGDVVYLGALELCGMSLDDPAGPERAQTLASELPRQLLAAAAAGEGRIWLVSRGVQPIDGKLDAGAIWQAPLWGWGRGFAVEHPDKWGGLIDLPAEADPVAAAGALLASLDANDEEDQTAWRGGQRVAARLLQTAAPPPATPRFRADGCYLVTGGFGGLGLVTARWMAEHGARHIALLGRHADPWADGVRAIEALGSKVYALQGDVADEAVMQRVLAQLRDEAPPLRGVVHAAAVMSAAPLTQLSQSQIADMLRPKLAGTLVLERLTREGELDFLVLFSSTTALLGASGLSHYAAANSFLDAIAQAANSTRRVISVNWGTWEVMRLASADSRRNFLESGLQPMATSAALDALGRLLAGSSPQSIVAAVDWNVPGPLYEARRPRPFLSHVRPRLATRTSPTDLMPGLKDSLLAAPAATRVDLLVDLVRHEVATVLGLESAASVPSATSLFDLGMDSLTAVELRNRLQQVLERSVSPNIVFEWPTVGAMASHLDSMWGAGPNADARLSEALSREESTL
jgi:acyl transferase domain-containing protein/SAM-dependent methyltransferase/acyl carrier protein